MSEKKNTVARVIVAEKNLLLAVERRSNAISGCCPSLIEDEEDESFRLRKAYETQKEVDDAVKALRDATEGRLTKYSDTEAILITHLWAGIWSSENSLRVDSNDLDKIAGRNNSEALGVLIRGLLEGTSPLFDFISLVWTSNNRVGGGYYAIGISNPNRLHRLLLGDIQIS